MGRYSTGHPIGPISSGGGNGAGYASANLNGTVKGRGLMLDRAFLRPILDDDSLTRGLCDVEARLLVDWLVERAENLAASSLAENVRQDRLRVLCLRAKSVGRFVRLWCYEDEPGAAVQLAGTEAGHWPLPNGPEDAPELMTRLLRSEERRVASAA